MVGSGNRNTSSGRKNVSTKKIYLDRIEKQESENVKNLYLSYQRPSYRKRHVKILSVDFTPKNNTSAGKSLI